ncbi:hypothetical protein J3458_014317 [Metarhizium acridum]|uniref:uncharacterized protein n=1 Tax=Metarhizium acridum TaxID=92637 RepID=UPI001C6BD017|nr:hypothetical protein J3458_021182 [Metarhizium acridum]KAG8412608.1 hypothetical protein J3458_014317 [Metarhizium acridum]
MLEVESRARLRIEPVACIMDFFVLNKHAGQMLEPASTVLLGPTLGRHTFQPPQTFAPRKLPCHCQQSALAVPVSIVTLQIPSIESNMPSHPDFQQFASRASYAHKVVHVRQQSSTRTTTANAVTAQDLELDIAAVMISRHNSLPLPVFPMPEAPTKLTNLQTSHICGTIRQGGLNGNSPV